MHGQQKLSINNNGKLATTLVFYPAFVLEKLRG